MQSTLQAAEAELGPLIMENTEAPIFLPRQITVCVCLDMGFYVCCIATECVCICTSMFVPLDACGDALVTPHNRHRYYRAKFSPEQRLSSSFW